MRLRKNIKYPMSFEQRVCLSELSNIPREFKYKESMLILEYYLVRSVSTLVLEFP